MDDLEDPIQVYIWAFDDGDSGEPGDPCDASGGIGALDEIGRCKTFWIDGETDSAISRYGHEEWIARGEPTITEMCLALSDELDGEFGVSSENPLMNEIVAAALQRYYNVGQLWPPKSDGKSFEDERSPYWVIRSWEKAMAIIRRDLCGV